MNIGKLFAGAGIIVLLTLIILVIGLMRVFKKANRPQLSAIFPILNIIEYSQIAGKPGWWGIVMCALPLIPFGDNMIGTYLAYAISLAMHIALSHGLATSFGKGPEFTAGLTLLPGVFHCILGFGDAEYRGPEGSVARSIYEEKSVHEESETKEDENV